MSSSESKGRRVLVWIDLIALGLRALAFLTCLVTAVLYFIPGVDSTPVVQTALRAILVDLICLAVLFATGFASRLFRPRTMWSFVGAAALLFGDLFLVAFILVEQTGPAPFWTALAAALILAYFLVPGALASLDVIERFRRS